MVSSRQWNSADALDVFSSEDAPASEIEQPPLGAGHRRRSSIPKPSPGAPLFRSNHVDRLYSKIPYPKKGGNLYYDILTGEQKVRKTKSKEPTPRGGVTNLTKHGEKRHLRSQSCGLPCDEIKQETQGVGAVVDRSTSDDISGPEVEVEAECPQTPVTSRVSTLPHHSRSMSSSSQSTFLECGSDMTELEEWDASDSQQSRRCSFGNSEMAFASFLHEEEEEEDFSKSELPAFKPLPPTLLLECIESERRRSEEDRAPNSRLLSASDLHENDDTQIEGKTGCGSPAVSAGRSSVYRVGCFRRRPQIPVSESSDDDCDAESVDSCMTARMSPEMVKKRRFLCEALAQSRRKASTPMEALDLDDPWGHDLHDSPASIPGLLKGDTPEEWYRKCHDKYFEGAPAAKGKHSSDTGHHSNPLARWFRKTVGASLKTLAVASSVAFVHIFFDQSQQQQQQQQQTMQKSTTAQNHGAEAQELEFDDFEKDDYLDLSFSSCMFASHAPVADGYPSSLLESMPDAAE